MKLKKHLKTRHKQKTFTKTKHKNKEHIVVLKIKIHFQNAHQVNAGVLLFNYKMKTIKLTEMQMVLRLLNTTNAECWVCIIYQSFPFAQYLLLMVMLNVNYVIHLQRHD